MSRVRLFWFDVRHALPVAARVLRAELGWARVLRALSAFGRRSVREDPFAALGGVGGLSDGEAFTRHQLRPVLLLDAVLRKDLGLSRDDTLRLLARVVAETGARFVAAQVALPDRPRWVALGTQGREALANRIFAGFGNVEAEVVEITEESLGVDVRACRFVQLSRRLDRGELAPLFCRADSLHFGRADVPVTFHRSTTLAEGGSCCDFRFRWEDPAD